jgi:ribonuclease E
VERRLKEALKHDRARIQVGRISHFGLLEMSRQRLRPGLIEGTFRTCPHCEGRGMVRSIASCSLGVIRAIEDWLLKRAENLTVTCARDVAFYLLNEKRDSLLSLEQTYGVTIFVVPALGEMKGTQHSIERASDRQVAPRRVVAAAPVRIDSAFGETAEEEAPAEEAAAETDQESDDIEHAADEDGETRDGGRRRRRRGRRGGRKGGYEREERGGDVREAVAAEVDEDLPAEDDATDQQSAEPDVAEPDEDETVRETEGAQPEGESSDEGEGRRRHRRDRFGRNRGRRGDRNGRHEREARNGSSEHREQSDRPEGEGRREHRRERGAPQLNTTPREPQAQIIIPDVIPDPEPRKWQPPAPTIQAEPSEKKGGWWSKRK